MRRNKALHQSSLALYRLTIFLNNAAQKLAHKLLSVTLNSDKAIII
jgi:hypothetical protein